MHILDKHKNISFTGDFWMIASFLILILPFRWLAAWTFACAVHELGHYIAVWFLTGDTPAIQFSMKGAVMQTGALRDGQEFIAALAGPLSGLLLILFSRWIPRTAFCAFFQSIYNLLPIYPMDGGRMIRSLVRILLPERIGQTVCQMIKWVCIGIILLMGLYGTWILHLGILPMLFSVMVFFRTKKNTLQRTEREGTIVLP